MPHHLLAFSGSIAQNAALAYIPTVSDQYWTQNNANVYTFAGNQRIHRAYAMIDSGTEVQFDTPNLRLIGPPQLQPYNTAATTPNLPPINKFDNSGLIVPALDPLGIRASRGGAGALPGWAGLWVGQDSIDPVTGPCRTIKGTAAIARVADTWQNGAITFSQALPTGRYRIIGMAAIGTGLLFARLIFPGQTQRPGVLAQEGQGEYDTEWFRYGNFGSFGEFDSIAPPTLEILGYAANTAQTIYLDVVPVGNVKGL